MTTRKNAGKPGDLHEIIADIAYTAGIARHYSGDSRADMHSYISWAEEFARGFTQEQEDNGDYMTLIEQFTNAKLAEAGNCDEPNLRVLALELRAALVDLAERADRSELKDGSSLDTLRASVVITKASAALEVPAS